MDIFQINEETCNKCGVCAAVCSAGLIDLQDDYFPTPIPTANEACNKCGACVIACPTGSFTHREIPLGQCSSIDSALKISFEQCAQLLKSRRSIRAYKDIPVLREDINRLIDAARYAPTGGNAQNVKWLVLDDKDKIQRLREIGVDFMIGALRNVPNYAPLVDLFTKQKEAGVDIFLHGAPAIVTTYAEENVPISSINCTIALAYFDLAANCIGLGCCWLGFFTNAANNFPPIKEIVSLPAGNQVYGSMIVGYPEYNYHRIPLRNPADITWRS